MKALIFNKMRFVFQAGKHLPYVLILIISKQARQAENVPLRSHSRFVILMLCFVAEFFCHLSQVVRIVSKSAPSPPSPFYFYIELIKPSGLLLCIILLDNFLCLLLFIIPQRM